MPRSTVNEVLILKYCIKQHFKLLWLFKSTLKKSFFFGYQFFDPIGLLVIWVAYCFIHVSLFLLLFHCFVIFLFSLFVSSHWPLPWPIWLLPPYIWIDIYTFYPTFQKTGSLGYFYLRAVGYQASLRYLVLPLNVSTAVRDQAINLCSLRLKTDGPISEIICVQTLHSSV